MDADAGESTADMLRRKKQREKETDVRHNVRRKIIKPSAPPPLQAIPGVEEQTIRSFTGSWSPAQVSTRAREDLVRRGATWSDLKELPPVVLTLQVAVGGLNITMTHGTGSGARACSRLYAFSLTAAGIVRLEGESVELRIVEDRFLMWTSIRCGQCSVCMYERTTTAATTGPPPSAERSDLSECDGEQVALPTANTPGPTPTENSSQQVVSHNPAWV